MSAPTRNTFVWFDLNTTDQAAATAFYSTLFGWTIETLDMGAAGPYTSITNQGCALGGLDDARGGAPAHWIGYILVDDTDQTTSRLAQHGGATLMPPFDIPTIGRMAVLSDPSGAPLSLWSPESTDSWEPHSDRTGDIGWAEVAATDPTAAMAYYEAGFGWTESGQMPTPNGPYRMLSLDGRPVAGMYDKPDEMPFGAWTFYVNVDDVDETADRAVGLGATVLVNQAIEGMVHFALLSDPQGAVIGIMKSLSEEAV